MLLPVLAGALWLVLVVWIIRTEGWPDDAPMWILMSILGAMTLGGTVAAGAGVAAAIGAHLPSRIDHAPSVVAELVTLRSTDGVEGQFRGSFFVGVGHIGTQLYYFWYERSGAAVTPRQLAAGQGTYVFEEDRETAEVRVFDWHFQQSWWRWFAIEDLGKTWEFHVPKGTVKQGYSL